MRARHTWYGAAGSSCLADPCRSDKQPAQWVGLPYVQWVGAAAIRTRGSLVGTGKPSGGLARPGGLGRSSRHWGQGGVQLGSLVGRPWAMWPPWAWAGPLFCPTQALLGPEGPDATQSSGTWITASARSPPAPGPSLAAGVTLSPQPLPPRSTWHPASARAGPSAWDALPLPLLPGPLRLGLPDDGAQLPFLTRCRHCLVTLTFLWVLTFSLPSLITRNLPKVPQPGRRPFRSARGPRRTPARRHARPCLHQLTPVFSLLPPCTQTSPRPDTSGTCGKLEVEREQLTGQAASAAGPPEQCPSPRGIGPRGAARKTILPSVRRSRRQSRQGSDYEGGGVGARGLRRPGDQGEKTHAAGVGWGRAYEELPGTGRSPELGFVG